MHINSENKAYSKLYKSSSKTHIYPSSIGKVGDLTLNSVKQFGTVL